MYQLISPKVKKSRRKVSGFFSLSSFVGQQPVRVKRIASTYFFLKCHAIVVVICNITPPGRNYPPDIEKCPMKSFSHTLSVIKPNMILSHYMQKFFRSHIIRPNYRPRIIEIFPVIRKISINQSVFLNNFIEKRCSRKRSKNGCLKRINT